MGKSFVTANFDLLTSFKKKLLFFALLSAGAIVFFSQVSKQQSFATGSITATSLTTGKVSTPSTVANTAIITIGANKLALIWVVQGSGGAATLSDPNRTWEQIATNTPGERRITLYRSMNATDTTGVITITSPVSTGMAWSVAEYNNTDISGINGSGAIAQFASRNYKDAGGARSLSGSVTLLPSGLVGSAVAGGFAMHSNAKPVFPGSGYALTGNIACVTVCVQAEFRDNFAQLVDMSWTNLAHWMVIAAELKASL